MMRRGCVGRFGLCALNRRQRIQHDIVDRLGASRLLERVSESVLIWVTVPTIEILEKRLLLRNTETPDPDSPFASLQGMKSMWDIPGLDENPDITREEYMRIVQNRLHDMKMKRQQQPGFSRTEGDDYLDKLNKKRDHTNQK